MRTLLIAAIGIGLTASTTVFPAQSAFAESDFRGLTLSMTPETLRKQIEPEYELVWSEAIYRTKQHDRDVRLVRDGTSCAKIAFSAENIVSEMNIYDCYFDAEDLSLREIVSQFVERFGGSAEAVYIREPVCKTAEPFEFKGRTDEGELFSISKDCAIRVQILPGSGKKPRF